MQAWFTIKVTIANVILSEAKNLSREDSILVEILRFAQNDTDKGIYRVLPQLE